MLLALLLLAIAAVWVNANLRKPANEASASGVVVEMVERYGPFFESDDSTRGRGLKYSGKPVTPSVAPLPLRI